MNEQGEFGHQRKVRANFAGVDLGIQLLCWPRLFELGVTFELVQLPLS